MTFGTVAHLDPDWLAESLFPILAMLLGSPSSNEDLADTQSMGMSLPLSVCIHCTIGRALY